MGLEFLRLRALLSRSTSHRKTRSNVRHCHREWHGDMVANNALNMFGVRKRSREALQSFDSARRIDHHFFGSKAKFEHVHATSRATTEQTTRLKFGWLRCPKPSSTTRLETPVSQTSPVVLADLVLYLIWVVDKITCWPKWVVPYLSEFVLQCYVYQYGIGKWVVPYRLWRFSHKFEHSKSTPYHFHLVLILSLTHFIWCWYIALALRSQPWICLFWIVIAC